MARRMIWQVVYFDSTSGRRRTKSFLRRGPADRFLEEQRRISDVVLIDRRSGAAIETNVS